MEYIALGKYIMKKDEFVFEIPENTTGSQNKNFLLLCKQGSGKTNLLQLIMFKLYKKYIDTDSKFGAIPIVFSPLFEFSNISLESKDNNLPPEDVPEPLDSLQYCFEMSNPPKDDENIKIIYIPFSELTIEDIASFAGYSNDNKVLGHLQKLIEDLKSEYKDEYDIDTFINKLRDYKPLYDALYYVFTKLRSQGFFNKKYQRFNWLESIKERKPIIFNFGDINIKTLYNTITGYLLRKLFELSNVYYNAYTKRDRMERAKDKGIETTEVMTDDEKFLIDNFYVALFFEESHQILYQSQSLNLNSCPAHYSYKQISDLLGRKKGFKYNFLVTQRIMELYIYFRKQSNYLIIGSEVYDDDINYMIKEMKFPKQAIPMIVGLPKYSFSLVNSAKMQARKDGSIAKFSAYRSPCGQL